MKKSGITITPDAGRIEFEYFESSKAGKLIISPSGKAGQRKIEFEVNY